MKTLDSRRGELRGRVSKLEPRISNARYRRRDARRGLSRLHYFTHRPFRACRGPVRIDWHRTLRLQEPGGTCPVYIRNRIYLILCSVKGN
jgi:hypothetical protein